MVDRLPSLGQTGQYRGTFLALLLTYAELGFPHC